MGVKIIVKNSRAHYDYFVEDKYECGVALMGTEVKSLRQGKALIAEAFVTIDSNHEVWLQNYMNINIIPELKRVNGVGDAQVFGGKN